MLVDYKKKKLDQMEKIIMKCLGDNIKIKKISKGVYIGPINMHLMIANAIDRYELRLKDENGYVYEYGVCDYPQQLLDKYGKFLEEHEDHFCISFSKIEKEGDWRWHKWGPYIGDKDPQCEYLRDEDDSIQEVYVYHVYRLEK